MKRNAIIFNTVDREDYWVKGLVFKVKNTNTYEDAYNEVKKKLESPNLVKYIIDDWHLIDDLFDNDETFKFKRTYWQYGLYFEFENSIGDIVEHKFAADFVFVAS